MLDFKIRLPQTKEEKIKYKEIRNNWEKVYNNKPKHKIAKRCIVIILLIIGMFSIYLLNSKSFTNPSGGKNLSNFELTTNFENQIVLPTGKRKVGTKTSEYLQKTFSISSLMAKWVTNAYEDLTKYNSIQYKYYDESISTIISEIEDLQNMDINNISLLKSYETYTQDYFGKVLEFFKTIKEAQSFDNNQYNSFVKWTSENTMPFDYLVILLEENKFDFTTEETEGQKKMTYQHSENAID